MIDWKDIVATHQTELWGTAYRILGNREDALECCQDALLDAFRYSQTNSVQRWGALLTSMTARKAIDRLRQRVRRGNADVVIEHVEEPATPYHSPEELAEAAELSKYLRETVAQLPDKQARVFWLCCIEGLSHQEVSKLLNISTNESHVLLHRARARIGLDLAQLYGSTKS